MTWSVNISSEGGKACADCKHLNFCNIVKVGPQLGSVLTSVDTCADGHMASGCADLKCSGFETIPEATADGDDTGTNDSEG